MSQRPAINPHHVDAEHQMQLKSMTAEDIAWFLHDHGAMRAVVEVLLELADEELKGAVK